MFLLECLKVTGDQRGEVLSFALTLSFCRLGQGYERSALTGRSLDVMALY